MSDFNINTNEVKKEREKIVVTATSDVNEIKLIYKFLEFITNRIENLQTNFSEMERFIENVKNKIESLEKRQQIRADYSVVNADRRLANVERPRGQFNNSDSHIQSWSREMPNANFPPSGTEERALECYICHDSHHTLRCNVLTESKNKKDVLYKYRLCIICGSHKWSANDPCSKSDHKCPACFKNHVLELCPSPAPLRSLSMKLNRNRRTNSDQKSISEDH